jgi:PKD repeat protein
MKTQSTYTDAGWDFATKWAIYPGMYEGYPFHLWYDTPPFVADFSASPLTGLAPLTVQFTDLSSGNPTSWSWNFDTDGTEDDASQNPQFTYNNPGTYTVTLNISGSSATDTLIRTAYITVIDAGNAIVSTPTGGNWTDASTWIDGVVPATDDDVIIQGPVIVNASRTCNNLTVLDTGMLENGSNYITLTVKGIINNQGVIRRASSYWLSVKAFKNIYNSGEMSFRELQLAGEVDQTLYQNGNGLFSMNMMSLLDTSNNVYSGSELTFSKTDISLNRGRFILNHPLNLTGGAKLRYVYLKGQNNELSFTKNAGLDQYAVISHAVLTDTVKILGSSVSLADGVVNAGVIENSQSFLTLDVIGDLQNEGVIRSVSPYWLMVKAFRDIYNSGDVSIYELQLAGEVDQTLYQNGNGLFSMNMMSLLDTSNNIYSGSELTFSKTNISLSRGRFILNHKLNLTDGAKLRYVNLNGQDNEISFTKNAGLDQYSVISNAVLTDTVIILYHSVSLADGVVNAGVIENGGSYYTLNVIGDVQNEGIVRNASPYSLTISLKGSLLNSGIWTPYRTNVEGTETQIIGMVDGINLGGDFYFYSDVTGSSYQWKKDAQNISGATSSSYKLTGLTPSEYGLYVCDVAGQMSRSIEVRRYGVVADFVADPLKIQPSMAVNFMDLSVGNPTWWNWTFGDGQSSTEQNPVHVYDDEGLFTVTLIAGDETYRDTLIREEYISVFFINEPPLSFSLIYPEDHGQIHTRRPTFYWRTAHDVDQGRKYVTGYRHYLADNEEMSDPLVSWCEEPKLALETDLNEDVQYWWKVEAVDDGDTSTFSETRTFFVNASNSVPEPFALISPLGDEETGGLPALLWHRSWDKDPGDVISYSVCLGRSIQDMTEIYTGSDTSFALTESLNENTRYFWRVNAVDLSGGQRRNMNEAGSFIVNSENDAPLPFELITPTPLSVEVTLTPLFYWEKSMDPDILDEVHYKLYLSPDSLFTDHTPVVLDTNTLVSHELADNGTYFWKVEALDDHGAVTGSPTHKFWTNTVMEPPLPFALLFPDNQATNIPLTPEFIWKKAVDPDPNDDAQYEILVASDSLFEDVVLNAFTARDTSYTPETELDNNRVYFWKIIATGMDSLSAESPVFSFVTTTLSIWDKLPIPEEFTLYQNYPNPFNPTTTIAYGVPESGVVRLDIYDITGRHIIQLVNGEKTPGWHTINWNCTNAYGQQLSSGVYIYRLTAPDIHLVKKMMVMK